MNTLPAPNQAVVPSDPQVSQVIELVLDGQPLREAVRQCGLTPNAFAYRLQVNREAAIAYARAVEIKADLMADEVIHLADGGGDPAKVRNQMQARQWLASKLHAKRYGDRIDLNVTQTVDISSTLAEARARLLPARYPAPDPFAQVIDLPSIPHAEPSDKESHAPTPGPQVPDIFS